MSRTAELIKNPLNEVEGNKEKSPTVTDTVEEKKIKSKTLINNSDTSIISQDNENVKDLSQKNENNFTPAPENNRSLKSCTFLCNVDTKPYTDKETAKRETRGIVSRTKSQKRIVTLTVERLAEAVTKGYSFTTAALNGTTEAHFISQQQAVVDIDNDREEIPYMTVDDAKKILNEHRIDYAFIYPSFNHTAEKPKFRIVIILDKAITEPQEAKRLNQYLISLFPQADRSCHNLDRFYYGTCHGLAGMVHNRTASITVPDNFKWEEAKQTEPTGNQTTDQTDKPFIGEDENEVKTKSGKKGAAGQEGKFNLTQAIREFNLLEYVEQTTGTKGVQHGKDVLFNPCPLCTHTDDFYIDSENTSLFICHSTHNPTGNRTGGNIINYLELKHGYDRKQAREYFIYDIMGQDRKAAYKKANTQEQSQAGETAKKIDLTNISTWEDITNKNLLLNILSIKDKSERTFNISTLRTIAKDCRRAAEFDKLLKVVQDEIKQAEREKFLEENPNGLYFTDCPILLNCSKYRGNDKGIFDYDVCIIPQPLVITKRTVEIESGNMKVELAAKIKNKWEYVTVDREIIANKTKIVSLASNGIMVTTENSSMIVNYLQSLEVENEDTIPTVNAVSHMGYIMDKTDIFVPYAEDLIYNGDTAYSGIYKSIHTKGNLETWVNLAKEIRNDSLAARVALATSFASPLIQRLDKLIFFSHLWGNSGTGKTVALKLSASIWGQPDKYIKNLNTTGVGFERNAYFFHNLPFILDELQTVRGDKLSQIIYMGTQGQGRMRGTVRGIEKLLEWRLTFLTAGEQPLTSNNSGAGEINRIIDIYVGDRVFKNPSFVHETISTNYGHAGKAFIESLKNYDIDEMIRKWESFVEIENEKTSGKQRMSASLLLCADELINRMFFGLSPLEAGNSTVDFWKQLSEVLVDTKDSDPVKRAYEFVIGWVTENKIKFTDDSLTERWGKFTSETVLISSNALENAIQKAGFNYRAMLKGFTEKNYIIPSSNPNNTRNTKAIWVNGCTIKGIELKLNIVEKDDFEVYPNEKSYPITIKI